MVGIKMRKKTFNIGDKIWMLTVVGHSLVKQNNGRKRNYYQCKCDCGNEKIVNVESFKLTNGRFKSCGCKRASVGGISNTKEYRMWKSAQERALKKGLEFSIQLEDIKIPSVCPLLNQKLIVGDKDYTPSLDRIDSKKGYTPDNIWVISHRANQIKNDATLDELKLITENLQKLK
jgi:hypothetical protein